MESIAEEVDRIYRRRVLRAREMDPVQKMLDGPRLYEMACRISRAGAKHQAGDVHAEAEFQRRLRIANILERRDRT